ncbi:hypothetical protein NSA50_18065 [Clostridium sp. DSM 100503]|uniref:hypothetical protein n=1 Tax=Clostridium sp. DSM 100503 TaxID=2963282 RepID=UPI00214A1DC8|nr:hypothetical protein [Clostridium sp. DSM 100503]MCR1952911.1 hypothetical protein [Clostridium sp. DSM 100503]
MKKKSILLLLTSLILISGVFVINKDKVNDFYKEDTTYVEDKANNNEIVNSNKLEESSAQNENLEANIIEASDEEIEKTKNIGLEFIKLIHSYDLNNGHESNVKKAIQYATESMKSFIIGTFIESKQPRLFKDFFAREVYEVNPIESKFNEDNSLTWEYELMSNILDKNKEIINREHNIVTLLFIKENNEWRVGNYATTQYR